MLTVSANSVTFVSTLWSVAALRARRARPDRPAPVLWVRLPWRRRSASGALAYAVTLMFGGKTVVIRGLDQWLLDYFLECDECVAFQPDIFSDEEISRIVRQGA